MFRRLVIVLFGLLLVAVTAPASATAAPAPRPIPTKVAGGLTPGGTTLAPAEYETRDCQLSGVHCKPTNLPGSCTGYSSQTTPPATIRVLVRDNETTTHIATVDFRTYVKDVLPNEWVATWDGDAVKSGSIAVKSFAWWWVTHYGGYKGDTPTSDNCFDVSDDDTFQVYKAGSNVERSNRLTDAVWPVAARRNGQIVLTEYRSYLATKPADKCGAGANGTMMSQTGSQDCNDTNSAYKYNVILHLYYGADLDLRTTAQLRTQHDFTYTAKSTPVTFSAGTWTVDDGYPTTFGFGATGDVPTVTTTGDGSATVGVWRPSNGVWYLGDALGNVARTVKFGVAGDQPVAAQYGGLDAPTTLAVFRPGNGYWYFAGSNGAADSNVAFGANGDVPTPGRWTSASADSIAVFRSANGYWYFPGRNPVQFGAKGDIAAPADYDGDGLTDIAVYRPSNHVFYVRGGATVVWGANGDIPVTGDVTGDGKADLVVYRPANHVFYTYGGAAVVATRAGFPVGAAPYRD